MAPVIAQMSPASQGEGQLLKHPLTSEFVQPMNGQYPRFQNSYFHEELPEHFLLTTAELEFVRSCRGNANRQDIAIVLSIVPWLVEPPQPRQNLISPGNTNAERTARAITSQSIG